MSNRVEIVRDAIKRFKHLPTRTIARHILYNHGDMFDGNLETIRDAVRWQMGAHGAKGRREAKDIIERTIVAKIPPTWRKNRPPFKLSPGLWLILSDIHIPFHEPKAVESAVKYGQEQKVTGILLNGDLQDCAAISYWPSAVKRDFDKEIEATIDFLDFLEQELPVPVVYKPGNHEYRLPHLFQSRAPELIGMPLAAMDTVLGLEVRGIEFLDYHQVVYAGKLPIIHGHEIKTLSRAVNPARGLFLKAKSWAACSHCHTTSEHTGRNIQGNYLTTWSFGCLSDLNPDYAPVASDWNHGVALVDVEKNGNFEVVNKRILPNGKVV